MRPQTLLVTGASSGIGRALALEYARGGARLVVAARRLDLLEGLAREIQAVGGSAIPLALDVSDPEAVRAAVVHADERLGSLDMVIANAGVGWTQHASTLDFQGVQRMIDVNLRGAIATLLAAVPVMLAHKKGHLVGVSSLAGRRALPLAAAYSATKAGFSAFLEGLRLDLQSADIRVTDVQPGFVESEITAKNDFHMPLLWPAPKAARVIARRLERAPAVVAFPWPLVLASSIVRVLPSWLYAPLVRLAAEGVGAAGANAARGAGGNASPGAPIDAPAPLRVAPR